MHTNCLSSAGEELEDSGVGQEGTESSKGKDQPRGPAWRVLDASAEVGTEDFNRRVQQGKDVSGCFRGTRYGRRSADSIGQKKGAMKLLEGTDVALDIETGRVSMPREQYEGLRAQLISHDTVAENFRKSFTNFYHVISK